MLNKERAAELVAEFLGTGILALTVLAIATSQIGLGYFVSFGAGLAVLLLVMSIGKVSGAVINPAITVGLWTIRRISTAKAAAYIAVQMLGGIAAFGLFGYLTGSDTWSNRSTGYDAQILVAEVLGTAVFAFGIAAAIFQGMSMAAKAAVIGGSLTLGIMIASVASAAFLNPAVALSAQTWEWGTYVLGPVLGAIIGFNLYSILFAATAGPAAPATVDAVSPTAVAKRSVAKQPAAAKATTAKKPARKTAAKKK